MRNKIISEMTTLGCNLVSMRYSLYELGNMRSTGDLSELAGSNGGDSYSYIISVKFSTFHTSHASYQ